MGEPFVFKKDDRAIALARSGVVIVAPGLKGQGVCHEARSAGKTRAATGESPALDRAIREAGMSDRYTIVTDAPTPTAAKGGRGGATAVADDELLLQTPLASGEGQILIYRDEGGRISLHLPAAADAAPRAAGVGRSSAGRKATFKVPLRKSQGGGAGRGGFSIVGKVFKVVAFKLLGKAVGYGALAAVRRWEEAYRSPEGFVAAHPKRLFAGKPRPFTSWGALDGRKSLLFIHGTTSTCAGAFGDLGSNAETLAAMFEKYEGRVLGFNHKTLGSGVADSAALLLQLLAKQGGNYAFDIVAHSRGGLVARAAKDLDEAGFSSLLGRTWSRPSKGSVEFGRLVFVGTPNSGTDLAIPDNLASFLNRASNLADLLPDMLGGFVFSAILSIAGMICENGLQTIPGLADQAPDSAFMNALNGLPRDSANYHAIQADFQSSGPLVHRFADKLVDSFFDGKANDLVVPTAGVSCWGSTTLKTAQIHEVSPTSGVYHTNYFGHAPALKQLVGWLS